MITHLAIELVDTVATAGVALVFYFLYRRRSEARLKLVAAAFAILFAGGGAHILLNDQTVRSFWVAVLIRLLGGFVLMVAAAAPPEFFRGSAWVNTFLITSLLSLAGGLAAILSLPYLGTQADTTLRRVVDILQLVTYAATGIMLLLRPVVGQRRMNLLVVGAIAAFAFSRVPFLWRSNTLDLFSYAGHFLRLVADLLLSTYAYLFALGSEKALNQALEEAVDRYKNLLSLITTAELAASSLDLSTILNRICRELALDLRFDRCCVILRSKPQKSPTIVALYHRDQDLFVPPTTLTLAECPHLHHVVEKGIVEEISDLKQFPLAECEKKLLGDSGSMLLIPLQVEKKSLGALYFWRQQAGGFAPNLVRLCQTAALVAALAIRKAFDYENLRTAYLGTVNALVKSIEANSPYTKG
ncbi:MAG: GAF domain-containing protein, partial [Syntrophothermus sp.]